MEVCPAKAISKRADGIVLIDVRRCIGCKYCSWACPYGAPQYDESSGVMTKCDFCVGRLEAGLPPACVAACPLRALDYGDFSEMQMRDGAQSQVPPLPGPDLTRPSLVIRPHRAAQQAEKKRAHIANREEV
jgi:anaerobic dimethyl sulfoxide reductase subunit B (iron-sulfur subunit)